jgi:hypothetical protein
MNRPRNSRMIEVIANDRMGRKGMSPLHLSIQPFTARPYVPSCLIDKVANLSPHTCLRPSIARADGSSSKMPSYRHSRRPNCRSDRNDTSEDPVEEMVCLPFFPPFSSDRFRPLWPGLQTMNQEWADNQVHCLQRSRQS